jgi:hypothetical protein
MTLNSFLEKLKQTPQNITFTETIAVIEENYFSPTAFENGILHNAAGENSVLVNCSLSEIQNLSEEATLSCFGAYYQEDVLGILMERVQEHSQLHENRLGRNCILW